jgi:ABC-2 type transport system permease protein
MATETMTATVPFATSTSPRVANFWDTLSSEWSKLISLRFTQISLGLGLGVSLATAAIASVALGSTETQWPEQFHPATFSMIGNIFSLIIYSVFGVMVMAGEYSSGMIRLTLTATPRRGRVFLAKLMLVTLIVLVFGLITTVGMFLVTQAVLEAYGMPLAGIGDADTRGLVLGLGASMPLFPIIGLALAAILRNTAGAITTVLALLWLPQIFGEVLPMWWRENIVSLLPQSGMDSLTIGHIERSPTFSEPIIAVTIVAVWLVAIVGAGYVRFVRSDA